MHIGGFTIFDRVDRTRRVNSLDQVLDPREQQRLRCKRFYASVLRRALDDLSALLSDAPMTAGDDDRPIALDERMELFSDTLDFFLNPKPSICSLDVICDALECGRPLRNMALAFELPKIRYCRLIVRR
jgi:hypothetical protein